MSPNKRVALGILSMLILAFGMFVGCTNQNTYSTEESISILFVGNSHVRTGNVPGQLQALASSHGIEMTYVDVSINGSGLDGALRDNAIREMQNRNFDYVVMQQPAGRGGRITTDVDGFFSNIRTFTEIVREHGATPVLYSSMWMGVDGRPNEEFHRIASEMFKQAAYENDAILVNVGDAWVYVYRTIPGISLYARDGIHANHAGAFFAANVFMATLFDLDIETIPTGNIIDRVPMRNIITLIGLVVTALVVIYRLVKKQPLRMMKLLVAVLLLVLLQVMSFFPHVFLFTEGGNRLLLLYAIGFSLLGVTICSVYRMIRMKLIEKQSWGTGKKYIFCILVCSVIYCLTFIPFLELRLPLYRGSDAIAIAQAAFEFVRL
ncbi:MAG: SGNH/GDSL hydrolase family protein [Oscillospiraceae bacterium]|nr:SGNH/GDSL hydrolase family protein [Oscillospiraceae bacterium]